MLILLSLHKNIVILNVVFCVVLINSVGLLDGYYLNKFYYFALVDLFIFCIFDLVPRCKPACLKMETVKRNTVCISISHLLLKLKWEILCD